VAFSRFADRASRAPRERLELLRRELSERSPQTLARFRSEFERVAGVFHRVASASDVPAELERICRERAARRLIAWPAEELGVAIAPRSPRPASPWRACRATCRRTPSAVACAR